MERRAQTEPAAPGDLLVRLDDELARLPDKYRAPVVLCDLEGMTRSAAARKLGWPVGTVNWRLAKARSMLAKRLTRQGMSLSAGVVAVALSGKSASASVPPALITETVQAGTAMVSGAALSSGWVYSNAFVLAEGVVKTMLVEKLKVGVTALVAFIMFAAIAGGFANRSTSAASEPSEEEQQANVAGGFAAHSASAANKPSKEEQEANPPAEKRKEDAPLANQEITNFRVDAPTTEIARKIGLAAEQYRKEKALEWLGRELPAWPERCPIRVKLTVGGFSSATTFAFDNGKVLQQSMMVESSLDHILKVDLPHEMTHVVLAHHFGCPIPRWADEGAAILSSAEEERRLHEKALERVLSEPGRQIPLRRLFPQMEYPSDVMALYAEGCSVTRFLVEAKDRKTFLKFIAAGKQDGWDKAVKRYYGYPGVDELEEAWLRSVSKREKRKEKEDSATRTSQFEQKLKLAFGKNCDEIKKAPIKLDVPARHLVLAANTFDILDDGQVKLSGCWYASFDKEKITTIRCNKAIVSFDGSITGLSDLSRRKILAIEPSGQVRIAFQPAEPDADSAPPPPQPAASIPR